MLDYLVVYESETGNTKKIATEIFASLPGMSKDLINLHERTDPRGQNLFCRFLCSPRNLQPRDRQLPFRSVVQIRCSLWNLRCRKQPGILQKDRIQCPDLA